jgi:hypothetical protein
MILWTMVSEIRTGRQDRTQCEQQLIALCNVVGGCAGKSSKRTLIIVAVTITALVVCIIIAVLTYWFAFRNKKKPYSRFPDASHDLNGKSLMWSSCLCSDLHEVATGRIGSTSCVVLSC